MILQFLVLYYYACAASSILSVNAISLSQDMCSVSLF